DAGEDVRPGGVELLVRAGRAEAGRRLGVVEGDPLGRAQAEGVAAGQGVDRELEALVDALLRAGAAGLVVDDLDAARGQAVDPVDRAVDQDRGRAVARVE